MTTLITVRGLFAECQQDRHDLCPGIHVSFLPGDDGGRYNLLVDLCECPHHHGDSAEEAPPLTMPLLGEFYD